MRGSPSQNGLTTSRAAPELCVQDKQQGNTGLVGQVARYAPWVALRRAAGVAVIVASLTITFTSATVTIVNHIAFIRRDHHRVVLGSEGPDQSIHIIVHPARQVIPDSPGHWAMVVSKLKLGSAF